MHQDQGRHCVYLPPTAQGWNYLHATKHFPLICQEPSYVFFFHFCLKNPLVMTSGTEHTEPDRKALHKLYSEAGE